MRKLMFFYLNLLVLQAFNAQTNNPAPYCLSAYTSTSSFPEISKVEILNYAGNMSNISTHTPAPGYTYYNNISTATLLSTSTATINVTLKNVDMETMLKAWIDYNNNFIFENNELVMSIPQGSVGTGMAVVKQNSFVVPWHNALTTRMRVSLGWHYANWSTSTFSLDACHTPTVGDGSAGETEDYNVFIAPFENVVELYGKENIQLFPNPSHAEVNISMELVEKIRNYEIIDRLGRIIIQSNTFPINVKDLEKEIYLIRFSLKDGAMYHTKLLVD